MQTHNKASLLQTVEYVQFFFPEKKKWHQVNISNDPFLRNPYQSYNNRCSSDWIRYLCFGASIVLMPTKWARVSQLISVIQRGSSWPLIPLLQLYEVTLLYPKLGITDEQVTEMGQLSFTTIIRLCGKSTTYNIELPVSIRSNIIHPVSQKE